MDDLLCVSECGYKTKTVNAFLAFKTDSKKLQYGAQKCKKLHVGKEIQQFKCQPLKIDNWQEIEVVDKETGLEEIEDFLNDEVEMEEKSDEKYLGDLISVDGRNIKNIKSRVSKAQGIITRILSILEGIPFGPYYFEVALILRNSLLNSSLLFNSESWYHITSAEIHLLESADVQLLRSILNVPKSTPKEMLYLELGCIPLRYLIQKRRILFLHYILNEDPNSMIHRFLMTQVKGKKKKDWIVQVFLDLKHLKLKEDLDIIRKTKKLKLKDILNRRIKENAFEELISQKENHSKVKHIKYNSFEMQKYLKPCETKITKEEAQEIFRLRTRTSDVKANFKGKYENLECYACKNDEETQKHVIEKCKILNENSEEKIPEYEEIFTGNVKMKHKIVKRFQENIKLREKLKTMKT